MTGSLFPPRHITDETGHGRHDVRVIRAAPAPESLTARWPGAGQIFLAESYRHPRAKAMGDISICTAAHPAGHDAGQNLIACARELGAKMSCEAVTGITSLTPAQAGPADLLTHNRGHWAIEVRHEVALCE